MREIKVQFQSFRDVREFSQLAARQPFQITVGTEKYRVNATSVLGIFTLNCRRPLTASFTCSEDDFLRFTGEAEKYLVK